MLQIDLWKNEFSAKFSSQSWIIRGIFRTQLNISDRIFEIIVNDFQISFTMGALLGSKYASGYG